MRPTIPAAPRRSPAKWKGYFFVLLAAFFLNWIWEMVQMKAYAGMSEQPLLQALTSCTIATFGDVGVTAFIFGLGALACGSPHWMSAGRWQSYLFATLAGAAHAVLTERAAVAAGRWTYETRMPLLPVLQVGLWPVLQLAILTPLSFALGFYRRDPKPWQRII